MLDSHIEPYDDDFDCLYVTCQALDSAESALDELIGSIEGLDGLNAQHCLEQLGRYLDVKIPTNLMVNLLGAS